MNEFEPLSIKTYKNGKFIQDADDALQVAAQDFLHERKLAGTTRKVDIELTLKSDNAFQIGTLDYTVKRNFPGESPDSGVESLFFSIQGDKILMKRPRELPQRLPLSEEITEKPEGGDLSLKNFSIMNLAAGVILTEIEERLQAAVHDIDDPEKVRTAARKIVLSFVLKVEADFSSAVLEHKIEIKFPEKKKKPKTESLWKLELVYIPPEGGEPIATEQNFQFIENETTQE